MKIDTHDLFSRKKYIYTTQIIGNIEKIMK